MMDDLFAGEETRDGQQECIAPGAMVLRGRALAVEDCLIAAVEQTVELAPFRHMQTPGGRRMSAAMTNCGALGWVTDRGGYRYTGHDPLSGKPWPPLPRVISRLAAEAAAEAGFPGFQPDACLVNRYTPGARMSLHQDRNEEDFSQPIVSVSLGLPVAFEFGGSRRAERPLRIPLRHGDVVVWGAESRLRFHGVRPLKDGRHPRLGACRINLTLRRAGPQPG